MCVAHLPIVSTVEGLTRCCFADFLGGLVPLLPYFVIESARTALYVSIAITTVVLLFFGGFKTYYTGAAIGFSGCATLGLPFFAFD